MTTPTDVDGSQVIALSTASAGEVLTLQRAAYVSEAQLHGDLALPPLTRTLQNLREELARAGARARCST
ncbi:MAG: hypothetical protein JO309_15280 [Pseudonocardiales bacterium]|nr:hypothetical protein [Pseudonocardiales bacterium]MBV9730733.1 hypothetical protein [Pseudonocardiales bacterium]